MLLFHMGLLLLLLLFFHLMLVVEVVVLLLLLLLSLNLHHGVLPLLHGCHTLGHHLLLPLHHLRGVYVLRC